MATSVLPVSFQHEPHSFYHSGMQDAAFKRILPQFLNEFQGASLKKKYFLQCLLKGVLRNKLCTSVYQTEFHNFGIPIFIMRNLTNTLCDPFERQSYVINLEDVYMSWCHQRSTMQASTYLESFFIAGALGLLSFVVTRWLVAAPAS